MHIESRALVIYHSLSHLKPYHLMMSNQLISRDSNMSIYVYERFVIPHIMRMSVFFIEAIYRIFMADLLFTTKA